MAPLPLVINSKQDLINLLENPDNSGVVLEYLQALMDERYNYDASQSWGVVEPNGLTRLGLTVAEVVALGAVDRAVGEPTRVEDLDAVKMAAAAAIDAKAEILRGLVLTPGAGQMAAYQAKEAQAAALLLDPAPSEALYPDIFNEVGITADTAHEVAMIIQAASEKWRIFGRAIEKARLSGKKAVSAALNADDVAAAVAAIAWPY